MLYRLIVSILLSGVALMPAHSSNVGEELQPIAAYQMPEYRDLKYTERQSLIVLAYEGDENAQDQLAVYIGFNAFKAVYTQRQEASPYLSFLFRYFSTSESIDTSSWPHIKDKAVFSDHYCYLLGLMVEHKIVSEVNPLVVTNLRARADADNAFAQCVLGAYYEHGIGVEKDPVQAAQLYRNASDKGNGAALYHLANCFSQGIGVEKDFFAASVMMNKSAQKEIIAAQLDLRFYLKLKPYVHEKSEALSSKANQLRGKLSEIIAHCQEKSTTEGSLCGLDPAAYSIDRLKGPYKAVEKFLGDKLCPLLLELGNAKCGFMLSCLDGSADPRRDGSVFDYDYHNKPNPYSKDDFKGTITVGMENIVLAKKWIEYSKVMSAEIRLSMRCLSDLRDLLRPSIASLHASQQELFSVQREVTEFPDNQEAKFRLQDAVRTFNRKKEKYERVAAINQVEIDILTGFIAMLDPILEDLTTLMSSTQSARNDEFLQFWGLYAVKEAAQ